MKWLLICLCLLHLLLDFSNGCALPTESSPISVCAFCSNNHAGVRWMVHRSNDDRHIFDSKRIDTIDINFQCQDPQGNIMISRDDCFDGSRLPYVGSVSTDEWRWYTLERNLSQGTECSFTATLLNELYRLKWTLEITTCTVGDCSKTEDCLTSPFPAVCSGGEPGDSVCSCSCSDGFSGGVGRAGGLLCKNINECASGAHQCGDIDNCIDTDGGHKCLRDPNNITTSADVPITTRSTPTLTDLLLPTTTPVQVNVNTDTPTDTSPLSVQAFCSDKHVGVRWMVHESNENRSIFDPERVDSIDIEFRCLAPEGNVISRDDCFNGNYLPAVYSAKAGEWRWYTLEREMSEGTECNFTTVVRNTLFRIRKTLGTSTCSVKSSLECSEADNCLTSPFPAVCSGGEPGDSICSCSCSDGFSGGVVLAGGLLCRNIDECTMGTHRCGDVGNCVDTEGSYNCLSAHSSSDTARRDPPTTTTASASTTDSNGGDIIRSTSHTIATKTTIAASAASTAVKSVATTLPASGVHDGHLSYTTSTEPTIRDVLQP